VGFFAQISPIRYDQCNLGDASKSHIKWPWIHVYGYQGEQFNKVLDEWALINVEMDQVLKGLEDLMERSSIVPKSSCS